MNLECLRKVEYLLQYLIIATNIYLGIFNYILRFQFFNYQITFLKSSVKIYIIFFKYNNFFRYLD